MMRPTPRRLLLATCLTLVSACSGESAESPAVADTEGGAWVSALASLPSGTLLGVALDHALSSGSAVAGDRFVGRVVDAVTTHEGMVAIPAGSAVRGTITGVSPASSTSSEGTLTLVVSSVTLSGVSRDLDASIEGFETAHQSGAESILGRVIGGNSKGTIIGRAAGAVAGTGVSVAVRDRDIVLPAGAHLLLKLRSSFSTIPR